MGEGVSTRIQKEIATLQSSYVELNAKVDTSIAQLRSEIQTNTEQKPPAPIDLSSPSNAPGVLGPVTSTTASHNSSSSNSSGDSTRSYTKHLKIECPHFDGSDFVGWHHRILQFFEADSTPEHTKIRTVMMHLEGRALQWHLHFMRIAEASGQVTWHDYILGMRERFGCNQYRDPLSELIASRQIGTVDEYYVKFESILNLLKLTDVDAMSFFLTNLKPEIAQQESTEDTMEQDAYVGSSEFVDDTAPAGGPDSAPIISLHALLGVAGVQVQVANGKQLQCQEICQQLKWEVEGLVQEIDVHLIQLLGCDMVLGVQWLKTLGPIWWDFNELMMKFFFGNTLYTLTGLSAAEVKLISEKHESRQAFSQQSLCTMLLYTGKA
ncbi:Retrotransposon gag protein [Corchorus olitorius]|uniref:Retrotransposon gag protein n=1 Tax=Corchorus olitorius TaxID=93759 RepID=A0A1R3HBW4_9ROSI|nr:Retrotransposon gag protein [Corchorus olitorius]